MKISIETIRLRFRNKVYLPLTREWRKKRINCVDFTIISNNCWGGTVYESYGLRKLSPTVGMFIMPMDYIKLINNLRYYLSQPLEFVEPDQSKWRNALEAKSNWKTYPIARLDDIELHMLHYHDKDVARSKWESRIKRINWNKMVFKFCDQNGATRKDIEAFMSSSLENKLCFVADENKKVNSQVILIKQMDDIAGGVKASKEPFGKSRYLDVNKYLNLL